MYTNFDVNQIEIATSSVYTHTHAHIHRENLSSREIGEGTLGLFVKNLQPKVDFWRYDILFAYFVVEAKSKNNKARKGEGGVKRLFFA